MRWFAREPRSVDARTARPRVWVEPARVWGPSSRHRYVNVVLLRALKYDNHHRQNNLTGFPVRMGHDKLSDMGLDNVRPPADMWGKQGAAHERPVSPSGPSERVPVFRLLRSPFSVVSTPIFAKTGSCFSIFYAYQILFTPFQIFANFQDLCTLFLQFLANIFKFQGRRTILCVCKFRQNLLHGF